MKRPVDCLRHSSGGRWRGRRGRDCDRRLTDRGDCGPVHLGRAVRGTGDTAVGRQSTLLPSGQTAMSMPDKVAELSLGADRRTAVPRSVSRGCPLAGPAIAAPALPSPRQSPAFTEVAGPAPPRPPVFPYLNRIEDGPPSASGRPGHAHLAAVVSLARKRHQVIMQILWSRPVVPGALPSLVGRRQVVRPANDGRRHLILVSSVHMVASFQQCSFEREPGRQVGPHLL